MGNLIKPSSRRVAKRTEAAQVICKAFREVSDTEKTLSKILLNK